VRLSAPEDGPVRVETYSATYVINNCCVEAEFVYVDCIHATGCKIKKKNDINNSGAIPLLPHTSSWHGA
jgi:hypothetical protein